jgi:hypothetical protein
VERARVAAVLIALNLKASEPQPSPPAEPPPAPSEPKAPQGLVIGVRLLGEAAYASAIEQGAGGAGLGFFLGQHAFFVGLDVGLLSPAEVALQERGALSPTVALLRLPIVLAASYRPRLGDFSLGPSAGLALDLLRLQGENVERPQTELRVNPGVFGAAELGWHFAPSLLATLRLGLSAFPRAYDLSVDPEGPLGRTPQLWLSAGLGLGWLAP